VFLLDRRSELRRLIDFEAVFVAFHFPFVLVCRFIDRNFITEDLLT
jgi:hypothetical protein